MTRSEKIFCTVIVLLVVAVVAGEVTLRKIRDTRPVPVEVGK